MVKRSLSMGDFGSSCGNACDCKECNHKRKLDSMGFTLSSLIDPIAKQVDQYIQNPLSIITGPSPTPSTTPPPATTATPTSAATAAAAAAASASKTSTYITYGALGLGVILVLYVLMPKGGRSERVVYRDRPEAEPRGA